jgi:hypothetical protein
MFTYTAARMDGGGACRCYRAPVVTAECELAAASAVWSCVRERAAAGGISPWPSGALRITGRALESMFAHYGVPLFL